MHPRLMRIHEFLMFIFKPESSIPDSTAGPNATFRRTHYYDVRSVAGIIKVIVWVILAIAAALGIGLL